MDRQPLPFYRGPEHEPFVFPADGGVDTGALLIHGFMGSPKELRPLGRALAAVGIDAHGVLLPGFGAGVAGLGTVRAADWIGAASAVWEDLAGRYRRTVLLGFSMGGAVALHVAARRPPDRLILVAPLFRLADRRAAVLPLLRYVKKEFMPYEHADFSREQVRWDFQHLDAAIDLDDRDVQARIRREAVIPTSALAELWSLSRAAGRVGRRAVAPTLVIQGAEDRIVRAADTRRLLAHLGGVLTYREIAADHMLPFDDRTWWSTVRDEILAFAAVKETSRSMVR